MAPLVSSSTSYGLAAIILYALCATGAAICMSYCIRQQYIKHTPYTFWICGASGWLLVSQILIGIRCFSDQDAAHSIPVVFTRVSAPIAFSKLAYLMAESEYFLLTCNMVDVRSLRRRITVCIFGCTALCWVLRFLMDYGIWEPSIPSVYYLDMFLLSLFFFALDVVDVTIQLRMILLIQRLFRSDESGRKRYVSIAGTLLVALIVYNVASIGLYIANSVIWNVMRDAAESFLLINTTVATIHFGLTIALMETGRQCLLETRSTTRLAKAITADPHATLQPRSREAAAGHVAQLVSGDSIAPMPTLMNE
ncbi:hypothetical protein BC831DRAFT_453507 [Entophlyctis helioformis]|nr:hypothetical protein BC831DRAFT_453507 [Entophlyctis helioformis]